MRAPDRLLAWTGLLALSVVLLAAAPARAYVGPGAGLELVGYFTSLLVWAGVAFSAAFAYPFYALIRRLRGKSGAPSGAEAGSSSGEPG